MTVYAIRSEKDGRFYVGMTENIHRRLKEHNEGRTRSTKGYTPWKIVFTEEYPTRLEARKREKYLKSGVGKEYIKEYWTRSTTG